MERERVLVALDHQKGLGQYATPEGVARFLVEWASRGDDPILLEPGFGGCIFLHVALAHLHARFSDAANRLYGVDVDPDARQYLDEALRYGADPSQFLTADFLAVTPTSFNGVKFSAVLGNPPFVRHSRISDDAKTIAKACLSDGVPDLSGQASYWAYFLVHSLHFLRHGGRIAFVLPRAFLHADYAREIRTFLFSQFASITLVIISERIFSGAEEQAVLLLADQWGERNRSVQVIVADKANDLAELKMPSEANRECDKDHLMESLLTPETRRVYASSLGREDVLLLRDVFKVKIGVVTGANDFFIVPQASFAACSRRVRILLKSRCLKGIELTDSDFEALASSGKPCFLLDIRQGESIPNTLAEYIDVGSYQGLETVYKCRKRPCWYCVGDTAVPPAFLTYMVGGSPRIVVNSASTTSTNSIHRLFWDHQPNGVSARSMALGSLSTLFRLSAEISGRSYGGGVLKLEPSEAGSLVVPVIDDSLCESLFPEVDELLRYGRLEEANIAVDKAILRDRLGFSDADISVLRSGLSTLQSLRKVPRGRSRRTE